MDRTEQLAKLENYRRKRAEERQRKLTERPPWRPTGRATSASQQRQAATTSYRTSRTSQQKKNARRNGLPRPQPVDIAEMKTTEELRDTNSAPPLGSGVKMRMTPIINQMDQMTIDSPKVAVPILALNTKEEKNQSMDTTIDDLGTKKWLKVYEESETKLQTYQTLITSWSLLPDDEFWRLEIERVKGEAALFLGPKSKHTQFRKMCLDPSNEKFKVEKEDDLQAFWDALVLPSIADFCNRVEWLKRSAERKWADEQKTTKPICTIGQSPARPSRKRNLEMTDEERAEKAKKDQERKERMLKTKKAAEERRAAMRKMMREKKRLASEEESQANKENPDEIIASISMGKEEKSSIMHEMTNVN